MKTNIWLILAFSLFLFSCSISNEKVSEELRAVDYGWLKSNFQNPPNETGVNCWWWWLNGNVNKAAITKDLEAMKSRNFQGAMIFDAGGYNQRGNKDIPTGPLFGSDEWNNLFVFAMDEAKRLDLEMGFNIQSGWNLGGPRVTPQYTAKQITFSETNISGNKKVIEKLELPKSRRDFYNDIVVLAFPITASNKTNELITDLALKLGYHELGGSAPDTRFFVRQYSSQQKENRGKNKLYC